MSAPDAIILTDIDDVATVLRPIGAGETVVMITAEGERRLIATETIPMGHKIALAPLPAGSAVHKYGEIIGRLRIVVGEGDLVHIHNLRSNRAQTLRSER